MLLERGIVTGEDASEAMAYLLAVTGSEAVALGQGYKFAPWDAQQGLPDSWIASHARYHSQDNIVPQLAATPPGHWFFVNHSTPAEKDTDLYHHFGDHFGDGAIVRLYSPFVSDLHLVLYRGRSRLFLEDDELLLRTLYPHLARGLATRRALAALNSDPSETMEEVLRDVAGHATISFPSGRVVWSARSQELWRSRLQLGERGWDRLDRMLLHACARFDGGALEARSQVLVPGVRVDFANAPAEPGERRRVLCFLVVDDVAPKDDPTPAEALLTDRQRTVARLLVSGASLPEVARSLRISLETARSYRREIYERLGVHNRPELVTTLR